MSSRFTVVMVVLDLDLPRRVLELRRGGQRRGKDVDPSEGIGNVGCWISIWDHGSSPDSQTWLKDVRFHGQTWGSSGTLQASGELGRIMLQSGSQYFIHRLLHLYFHTEHHNLDLQITGTQGVIALRTKATNEPSVLWRVGRIASLSATSRPLPRVGTPL